MFEPRPNVAGLLDVELAHVLLGADDFHLVPQLVGEPDFLRNAIHQNNGRRKIGSVHFDIFQPDNPIDERLQNLDVFYAIQLQGLGDFAENALGHFQALARQLENMVFGLQVPSQPDEDRDDEPAEEEAKDKTAEIFQLRGRPAPDRFFRHGSSSIKVAAEHKHGGKPTLPRGGSRAPPRDDNSTRLR